MVLAMRGRDDLMDARRARPSVATHHFEALTHWIETCSTGRASRTRSREAYRTAPGRRYPAQRPRNKIMSIFNGMCLALDQ